MTTTTSPLSRKKKDDCLPKIPVVVLHSLDEDGEPITFVEYCPYRSFDEARGESFSTVQALAVSVPAKDCSRIVKALAPLPPALNHLKRVKNQHKTNQNTCPENSSSNDAMHLSAESSAACLDVTPTHHSNINTSGFPSTVDQHPHLDQHQHQPIKRARVCLGQVSGAHGSLLILLGLEPIDHFIEKESSDATGNVGRSLLRIIMGDKYDTYIGESKNDPDTVLRSLLHRVSVPEKPPQSQDQAKKANQLWPTQFFPLKSLEYRHQQLALPKEDMARMHRLLRDHILNKSFLVAVVVDPSSLEEGKNVLASSWEEQALQQPVSSSVNNPLATPILCAIQGVARLERERQIETTKSSGKNEDSRSRKKPSYLCTDYELYSNYEPTVFEAMACVHSRFSRLIFCGPGTSGPSQKLGGVWRKALSSHGIHSLPGTNHRFRAFEYREGGNVGRETIPH